VLSEQQDVVLCTLDLYGAIATFDLSAAIDGELEGLEYQVVSQDGTWGTAFPDRASAFRWRGRDHAVVTNAGPPGGLVVVDLATRRIVARFDTPTGLEAPLWAPERELLVTLRSGKTKVRTPTGIEKSYEPGSELMIFDLSQAKSPQAARQRRIDFDMATGFLSLVDGRFVLVSGDDGRGSWLVVYDLESETMVDRARAFGSVQRMEVRPGD
jgi:hypothetical protein